MNITHNMNEYLLCKTKEQLKSEKMSDAERAEYLNTITQIIRNNDEIVSAVYRTTDYDKFKTLDGNRTVEKSRVNKILKSINDNGYIHCPITVNERMEIIDGQGRLEAVKQLGLPVEYIVFKGLSINECVALNVYQTGWTLMDYIESHADRQNLCYKFLLHLISKYRQLGTNVVINAITGTLGNNNRITNEIKAGDFECTSEQYERADELLGYTMKFLKTIKNFNKGPITYICMAIMFAYQVEDVDKEKLLQKFETYYGMEDVPPFISVDGALKTLTTIYNRRNRSDKIYFEVEYDRFLSGKYTWYANKYGIKKKFTEE